MNKEYRLKIEVDSPDGRRRLHIPDDITSREAAGLAVVLGTQVSPGVDAKMAKWEWIKQFNLERLFLLSEEKEQKTRYLVIDHPDSGVAQMANVMIVDAKDETDARRIACERSGYVEGARFKMKAFEMDELEDGWAFYQ